MAHLYGITSPKFSFVDFNTVEDTDGCCNGCKAVCLPVVNDNDLVFQLTIEANSIAFTNRIFATDLSNIHLILLDSSGAEIHDFTVDDGLQFEVYRTGVFKVTYIWRHPLLGLTITGGDDAPPLISCDQTFALKIRTELTFGDESITHEVVSNCFVRRCDNCFTSLIEFYNDDDYADYHYCNIENPINRVRLDLYPGQAKYPEEKSVYRKSNGIMKQTKSLLTKEYVIKTEYYPESFHDKMTIALAHDYINIVSSIYSGGISKSGEYTIDWKNNNCTAPAEFKAATTPFAVRNNNCADCNEVVLPECNAITIEGGSIVLPDAGIGVPYNYHLYLLGTAPFEFESPDSLIKPSWMTITIVGNVLTFSGTPDVVEIISVAFNIVNCLLAPFEFNSNVQVLGYGRMSLNCEVPAHDNIPFGLAGIYYLTLDITVVYAGIIHIVVHSDQVGSLGGGWCIAYEGDILVAAGQIEINVPLEYDGGGINRGYHYEFSVTDDHGNTTCESQEIFYS